VYGAAQAAIRGLIAKYARYTSRTVGDLSITDVASRIQNYKLLLEQIAAQFSLFAVPTAGGISISEKQALEADGDRPTTYFKLGMHQNPEAAHIVTVPERVPGEATE